MASTTFKHRARNLLTMKEAEVAACGLIEPKSLLIPVKVAIVVETKGEPSTRLEMVLTEVIDKTLDYVAMTLSKGIAAQVKQVQRKGANEEQLKQLVSKQIDGAETYAKNRVQEAVEKRLEEEASKDQLLLEAKIKLVVQFVKGTISLVKSAGEIVASGGTDVKAWYELISEVKGLTEAILVCFTKDTKLLKELKVARNELEKCLWELERSTNLAKDTTGLDKLFKNLGKLKEWVLWKKQADATTTSRDNYRNAVFKTRKEIDKLADPIKRMESTMKAAKNLKDGVKIGATLMSVKRSVRLAIADYDAKLDLLKQLDADLKALGAEVDDRTWSKKFDDFKKALKSKNF